MAVAGLKPEERLALGFNSSALLRKLRRWWSPSPFGTRVASSASRFDSSSFRQIMEGEVAAVATPASNVGGVSAQGFDSSAFRHGEYGDGGRHGPLLMGWRQKRRGSTPLLSANVCD